MSFCESCGTALKPGAKFCSGCGGMLATQSTNISNSNNGRSLRMPTRMTSIVVVIGLLALGLSVWLYTRSFSGYGPSADANDDGFITLAEAEKELADFPKGKRGKWEFKVEAIDFEIDKSYKSQVIEELIRAFQADSCSKDFSHFYQIDADEPFYTEVRSADHIIEEFSAEGPMVKYSRTLNDTSNVEKMARTSVVGVFNDEAANFQFTYGGRENQNASGRYEPYYRLQVVATRVGDCASGGEL